MELSSSLRFESCVCFLLFLPLWMINGNGQPLVPALFIFGDSIVDVGNNNHLLTLVKADFPPYGRDFLNQHQPTGRFSNGKLASDFTAENLGFTSYPPPYNSKQVKDGLNITLGVNFASGSSGYYHGTAKLYNTISLNQQIENYKEYQNRLSGLTENASSIINGSIHIISAGSSDYIQNYFINPLLFAVYSTDQFSDILIKSYINFIKDLYKLGARKIGVTTLPPMGCLPAAITLFGKGSNECVEKLNKAAISFNGKLNVTSMKLKTELLNLNLVILDVYQPLLALVNHPSDNGFAEARKACCGTGLVETAILCNKYSPGTCKNASEYVFWDGFHPTESANKFISDALLLSGIALIS
ncbi:GDSL esterase/lipase At5g22810-like [Impatiens glandulifera]|uniref:GDSL esterase/lipase At5g22810-like n=1 Tax=Impatiens glandulifera TaxID=253017 RepID=UPI001FB0AE1C|nr:GDSL esterase/lipase At5g22810-like [Impatiens glandulifera]